MEADAGSPRMQRSHSEPERKAHQDAKQPPVKQEQLPTAAAAGGQKRPAPGGGDAGRPAKQVRHEAVAPKKPAPGRQGSKISAMLKKAKKNHTI